MAIKAGQILHAMNTFIVDRIQTGGPSNLNIPTERIHELGNYQSVAIVRDVPDLSFNLECLDVDTEVEALLTGSDDPGTDVFGDGAGQVAAEYALADSVNVDIVSPMKSAQGQFNAVKGVAIPHLTLESASYRYGLRDNASETFTLQGDSIFYVPGSPYVEITSLTAPQASGSAEVPFANTALKYTEQGVDIYALNVSYRLAAGGDWIRLIQDIDFTDTATGVTLIKTLAASDEVRITYGSGTIATFAQSVHEGVSVKPAAIKGKDINVYVGTTGATPLPTRWTDVQSFNVDYRVTLEDDYEFGNPRAVSRDYSDVPQVTGSIEIKPINLDALFDKLYEITGVTTTDIIGPQSSVTLPIEIQLLNPDSGGSEAHNPGDVLKTLYVPDARFTIPGFEGRQQQKMTNTLNFESDSGTLKVFKGEMDPTQRT